MRSRETDPDSAATGNRLYGRKMGVEERQRKARSLHFDMHRPCPTGYTKRFKRNATIYTDQTSSFGKSFLRSGAVDLVLSNHSAPDGSFHSTRERIEILECGGRERGFKSVKTGLRLEVPRFAFNLVSGWVEVLATAMLKSAHQVQQRVAKTYAASSAHQHEHQVPRPWVPSAQLRNAQKVKRNK